MSWFKLYTPSVLYRKVLIEKHVKASDTLEKIAMSSFTKNLYSYLSYLFLAAIIVYYVIVSFRLQPNIAMWDIEERAFLLFISVILSLLLKYFLTHQGDPEYEVLKIAPFSYNWFVKLGSIFAIYTSLLLTALLVYMFSCFTTDLSTIFTLKMELRGTLSAVLWVFTGIICVLSHNDIIPLYKITT